MREELRAINERERKRKKDNLEKREGLHETANLEEVFALFVTRFNRTTSKWKLSISIKFKIVGASLFDLPKHLSLLLLVTCFHVRLKSLGWSKTNATLLVQTTKIWFQLQWNLERLVIEQNHFEDERLSNDYNKKLPKGWNLIHSLTFEISA